MNWAPNSRYGTRYVESELILAAQARDEEEVSRLVATMTDVERADLKRAAEDLIKRLDDHP